MASLPNLALSVAAGSLTTLSPCVFPLLPLVLSGATQRNRLAPLATGIGMAASFALIGLLVGALGESLGFDASVARLIGALLLLVFGAAMFVPRLGDRVARAVAPLATSANAAASKIDGGSLAGSLALGGVLGLVWSPCSGPLLGSALTLVATEGSATQGALTLGLFGIGAATPLVAVAYASRAGFTRARALALRHADRLKAVVGVVLMGVGLAILTGTDRWLETQITSSLPDAWLSLTTKY